MVEMAARGAVEPGPPAAAVAPSPARAQAPAPEHLFRPISAEDEEQQPTEIESLCMNCYRNVRRGRGPRQREVELKRGRAWGLATLLGPVGDPEARHARESVDGELGLRWFLLAAFCFLRARRASSSPRSRSSEKSS